MALLFGAFGSKAETVTATVSYYDETTEEYVDVQGFETEFTKNEDGSFTLADFLNSGHPVSFKFEDPAAKAYAAITYCGDVLIDEGYEDYPYLMYKDEAGALQYMTCRVFEEGAEEDDFTEVSYVYGRQGEKNSYVFHYDMENPDNSYEYYACLTVSGYIGDDYAPWYYVEFNFNDPTSSAIETVESSEDAPVVYYNLQGVRVDNPTDGIYIQRKGNTARKVMIRK